jgi:hypothetical protein
MLKEKLMGLYNLIFGTNESADVLLARLGLTRASFYRFRDCWLENYQGEATIAVYTRAGGNNSQCWCGEYDPVNVETGVRDNGGKLHEAGCVALVNEALQTNALFVARVDDDFDSTYCTYYFRIPDKAQLADMNVSPDRNAAWLAFFDKWRE